MKIRRHSNGKTLCTSQVAEKDADQNDTVVETPTTIADSVANNNKNESISKSKYYLFLRYLHIKKRFWIPAAAVLVLTIIFVTPFSRYKILGIFIKEKYNIVIIDSTTNTPISGATVRVYDITTPTNANGQVTLDFPIGYNTVTISKQYYKSKSSTVLVNPWGSVNALRFQLVVIGRQVPIMVINKISGKPVMNATLKVLGTKAETDKNGKTIIVLPINAPIQQGTISADGYNQLASSVQVTNQEVDANTFSLVPAGRAYFLSNLSGKIDVVETNLDGSNRQTVVAGTGYETAGNTTLLAARDWKYLALLSKRDSSKQAKLYLITTASNTISIMDQGNDVTFGLVGWEGDNFVYTVDRPNAINGSYDQTALKSFNASSGQIKTIDQTDAQSSGPNISLRSSINATLLNDGIFYTKFWDRTGYYAPSSILSGKSQIFVKTKPDGSSAQVLKTVNATDYQSINLKQDKPDEVYFEMRGFDDTGNQRSPVYLKYEDNSLQSTTDVSDSDFYSDTYSTYLLSPSGNNTFWSVPTDGKNNLFVGDQSGNNGSSVAELSDYNPYGWYSDSYLLVSKGSSELYIMPVGGGSAIKISDYYKPSQIYRGYGGGYGGL